MKELVELRRKGATIMQLARKFDMPKSHIIEALKSSMTEAEYERCKVRLRREAFNRLRRDRRKSGDSHRLSPGQVAEIVQLRRLRWSYQDIAGHVKTSKAAAIYVCHHHITKDERDEIDAEVHRRRAQGLKEGYREGEINGCMTRWLKGWLALPEMASEGP